MEFDKVITERYSVRKFNGERLKQSDIDEILKAGHKAPTGCNYQPQRILVLNSKESIEKLKRCTRCHFNAPTAMLVCHNQDESWVRPYDRALSSPVDAVIVATHMMLKAQDIGVGCCWVMHFNPEKMCETFNIPKNIIPVALLAMGYPASDSKPLELHSKFRDMDETIYYDTF
ncbi:MAG: nitroreductase family protein [Clostridia bacterium]|nr:nitroreductase family protein [Clostridia bacterium]